MITFEEAYWRTGRILNIIVSSSRQNEVPRILNYLTAPKVMIWTACCASVAVFGLYQNIDLIAKDGDRVFPWNPSAIKWSDTYYESESIEQKLGEMFGVNHIIHSQASQIVTPFISSLAGSRFSSKTASKLSTFIATEIRHRISQLNYFGLVPKGLVEFFDDSSSSRMSTMNEIKIEPRIDLNDFKKVYSEVNHRFLVVPLILH